MPCLTNLAYIPFESIKRADKAYNDLHSHMKDMCDEALRKDATERKDTDMSIMGESSRPEYGCTSAYNTQILLSPARDPSPPKKMAKSWTVRR